MGWMLKHPNNVEVHYITSDVFVIGRDKQANIICRNILVSKYHSRITKESDGQLAVVDLKSSNGTFVNQEKIKPNEKIMLKEGDQVSFGMILSKQNEVKEPHYIYTVRWEPDVIEILTSDDELEQSTPKPSLKVPKKEFDLNAGTSTKDANEVLELRATQIQPSKTNESRPISPKNNIAENSLARDLKNRISTNSNLNSFSDTIASNNETQKKNNSINETQVNEGNNNNGQSRINDEKLEQSKENENNPPIILKQLHANGSNSEFKRTLRSGSSREKSLTNKSEQPGTSYNLPTCSKNLPPSKKSGSIRTGSVKLEKPDESLGQPGTSENLPTCSKTLPQTKKSNLIKTKSESVKHERRKNAYKNVDLEDADVNMEISTVKINENRVEPMKIVQDVIPVGKIHIASNLFPNKEQPLQSENSSGTEPELLNHPLLNIQMKQEPSMLDYSQEDNVVTVGDEDNEEGDMFMFSQLYIKPEIKVEEVVESEDTPPRNNNYLNDEDKVILIDDDDDELFSAVCSQMYIKEESFNNENVENEGGSKVNGTGMVDEEEYMKIKREVAAMDKFDDPSKLPPIVINDTMEFSDSEDIFNLADREIAAETNASKRIVAVPKGYTKPPIIEPHQLQPMTRAKRQAVTKLMEAVPAKRFRAPMRQTRGKRNQSLVKKPVAKDKDLQEARRKKLKEIAAKAAPKAKDKTDEGHKKITTAKQVRCSTGRGNFLLPPEEAPSTSKRVSIAARHEQIKNCANNVSNKRFIDEHGDVVRCIVMWNQKWINEQRGKDTLPPVAGKEIIKMCDSFGSYKDYYQVLQPLVITELWFNFCKEYERSSFSNQNLSGTHIAKITSVKTNDFYTEITCNSYLNKKSNACGDHLQVKNIVLLNAYFGLEKNSCKTFFGVVIWCRKEPLKLDQNTDKKMVQACGSLPTTKMSFMLVVKRFSESINQNYHINMRYFTFLPQYLRLISSLKALNTSPLLNHVIDPKSSDYVIKGGRTRDLLGEESLNQTQKEALNNVLNLLENNKPGLYLIEGPPGTGKSTVIINIILEFLLNQTHRTGCLLLLAPSNGAIDSIINKIMFAVKPNLKEEDRQKIKLVRVGNANAIDQNIFKYSLDEIAKAAVHRNFMKEHPQTQRDYENIGQKIKELREKLNRDPHDVQLMREIDKKVMERTNFAQNYLKSKYRCKLDEQRLIVLSHANIICSTIMSCPKILLKGFDVGTIKMCIIDEASQCSEPETLVPIGLGVDKIVLVGDPQQLPAISSSVLVKNYGYCRSLFTRVKLNLCRQKENPIKMLDVQYRMHPDISHFPNHEYYGGKLQTKFHYKKKPLEQLRPYLVFGQSSLNMKEYENEKEIELLMILIRAISAVVPKECSFNIGIITPYTIQRRSINTELGKLSLRRNITVTCNTVDSFQGQEKDVILLSCVRNTPNSFLSDEQRMNVSITRAKCALYIIGTETLLKNCSVLKKISSDAQKRKLYHKLSSNMTESSFRDLIIRKN